MIKLEEIHDMWKKDSVIPPTNLDDVSREAPQLHAKYLEFLNMFKMMLRKKQVEQNLLLKDKWLYYSGKMTKAEMDERNWKYDPFDGLKVLKGDLSYYYESDEDLNKLESKIQYYKMVIDTLTQIIDNIKWRHQTIRNMIDYQKFINGA